jgi:hypothetical protein
MCKTTEHHKKEINLHTYFNIVRKWYILLYIVIHVLSTFTNRMLSYFNVYTFHMLCECVSNWLLFSNFSAISWREQINFQWDDDEVRFVLDKHVEFL